MFPISQNYKPRSQLSMKSCWRKVKRVLHLRRRRATDNPEVVLNSQENAIELSLPDSPLTCASSPQKIYINDLPVEILSEIFELAVVRRYPTERKFVPVLPSFDRRAAPVNLIHVCQRWRNLAFDMPSLWASLSGSQCLPVGSSPLRGMSYWLNCSGSAPLHLQLLAAPPMKGIRDSSSRPMLQLFARHIHRWKSFSIVADSTELVEDFSYFLRWEDLPLLAGLEIQLPMSVPQDIVDNLVKIVRHLEHLRWVYWSDPEGGRKLPELSWSEYDKICVETPFPLKESIALLAQCTTATCVALLGSTGQGRPTWYNPAITLESQYTLCNLTRLTLDPASDPLAFLQYFTLPSLRYLELRVSQRNFTRLGDFLKKSQCALRELIIIATSMKAKDVVAFFNSSWLQTIPDVRLGPTHSNEEMLRLLQEFKAEEIGLPSLTIWMDESFYLPMFLFAGWKRDGHIVDPLWSYEACNIIYHPNSKMASVEDVDDFL